ncbi:copper radical oxidase [Coprinopsis sp. MPI-PUGE-AT-0042]|nr:copper radical oxidase [Coprinopsis sp. MPI-PUGE-AT-0042]
MRGSRSTAILVLSTVTQVIGGEPAWNGFLLPGSTNTGLRTTFFTPFYVPPGSKSFDSNSPLIRYQGTWHEASGIGYVGKSIKQTLRRNDSVEFRFTGTGIEWFGTTDKRHGIANVYVDGHLEKSVDAWRDYNNPRKQQKKFSKIDLTPGQHWIRLVNMGGSKRGRGEVMDLDAFVVHGTRHIESHPIGLLQRGRTSAGVSLKARDQGWRIRQEGTTGVNAMQLVVLSSTLALIVDKVEHNPLEINGHPAWGALYRLNTHEVRPLHLESNSFCNPVVESHTSAADFGDLNGLQAIRLFHPCNSGSGEGCDFIEDHQRIRMASPRWYNTVLRIEDGSAMIIGGSKKGGWMNNATVNNPTLEYYPPKNMHGYNGLPIPLQFLEETLNSNLFPIAFSLPDGRIFVAANQDAMIYDWKSNSEQRLPQIPNGVRVTYPMAGTGVLLPLSPDNDYQAEVLLCGGSKIDDQRPGYEISSQEEASKQCSRMVLTDDGIEKGWEVEHMPQARLMADAVLLPTGDILIVNGGSSGISGYGNVADQRGASNADQPVLTPLLYSPSKPFGERFQEEGMPRSDIPRLYHSTATLVPNGEVMVAGSNPNLDRSEEEYQTEYRVEWVSPPYIDMDRPEITEIPGTLDFGQRVELGAILPDGGEIKVALMDLGYVTHSVHANSRLVYLNAVSRKDGTLVVEGPPNGGVYPPGPGWLFVVAGGVPSKGKRVMVGDGGDPPFDQGALDQMLAVTSAPP